MKNDIVLFVLNRLENLKKYNVDGYVSHGYIGAVSSEEDEDGEWIKTDDIVGIIKQIKEGFIEQDHSHTQKEEVSFNFK